MRTMPSVFFALLLCLLLPACSTPLQPGRYLLDLRTGTFGSTPVEVALDLDKDSRGRWHATLLNGPERIQIPQVHTTEQGLILDIPHYDSWLDLRFEFLHKEWFITGTWTKNRGQEFPAIVMVEGKPIINYDQTRRGPFHIDTALNARTTGRYAVDFFDSGPAVLDLTINPNGSASASVRTPTGDYRFLEGRLDPRLPKRDEESQRRPETRLPGTLYLSTFDGAHMFAITGTLHDDGSIEGFFYSGNWWVEPFTATPDDNATIPDPFAQTRWTDNASLEDLIFTNLQGNPESLADLIRRAHKDNPKVIGPTIIEVFGSWCPNCHDAATYLAEIQHTYAPRGLRIVGLAFELTENIDRSINQVKQYQHRHNISWPVLVAGLADKELASESLPVLDRIRSFPTAIFLDRDKKVKGIHTGFTGPATGAAYDQMRAEYEAIIESLLQD